MEQCRVKVGKLGNKSQQLPGYVTVIAVSKNQKWKSLSPFNLRDEEGVIFENKWQFSKIYEKVHKTTQRQRYNSDVILWQHPSETHITSDGKITDEYWAWREKGFNHNMAVRRPVKKEYSHLCKGTIIENEDENYRKVGYIKARKRLYVPEYTRLVKETDRYKELEDMLTSGKNLLILDYDGPHYASMNYYREKYGDSIDISEDNTIDATEEQLKILLNDRKNPFGHGYETFRLATVWSLV